MYVLGDFVFKFDNMGEARLMDYILSTMTSDEKTWTYDKFKAVRIMSHCMIKEATVFNYLKSLTRKNILIKVSKGVYLINTEYLQYRTRKTG